MTYIKSPFNFIPVSNNVYFPDWSGQISHDIPFSDGICGVIHLAITTHTPTFVRNGHTKQDADDKNAVYKSFSNIADRYFIPGTSIKGEIRNILEILSFSKLDVDRRMLFAQREMGISGLYPIKATPDAIHCGWLRRKGENYEIRDCGKPYRISHKRLDEYIGRNIMESYFSEKHKLNLNEKIAGYDPKTAAFKYHLMNEAGVPTDNLSFEIDKENCTKNSSRRVFVSETGNITGTIVLTGQPNHWTERVSKEEKGTSEKTTPKGKYYEFVFANYEDTKKQMVYDLSKETFEHYKFIYQGSDEWKRIKKAIETSQGVPVFFRIEETGIKDFGMAYLYKLPYERTPYEALPKAHRQNGIDLAQCIFGYTSKDKSLKGRVQFGNAFSEDAQPDEDVTLVLNSPKASYYPIYIRQNGKNGIVTEYSTYNDGTPAGWKRYYIREHTWRNAMDQEKMNTVIHPVKAGAAFHSRLTFHNLRPVELGALLSALTYHGTPDCYHSLGQGKPYGFGKTSFHIELDCDNKNNDLEYYMACFEYAMTKELTTLSVSGQLTPWGTSGQVVTLLAMASKNVQGSSFEYMTMDMKGSNEFVKAKNAHEYLPPARQILTANIHLKSLYARGEEIYRPMIDAENAEIRESYNRRFDKLLSMPPQEALQNFHELKEELQEKYEKEKNKERRDFYYELKTEWATRRTTLEDAILANKDRQDFLTGIARLLTSLTSYGVWDGRMRKWKKWCAAYDNGRTALTEEEQKTGAAALAELYVNAKKADQRKFKWKEASKILGIEINADNIKDYLKR